ncbi:MAG: glycosyltransferase [Bacteriovoracaceae bacterium]|nr:glycosyltransferase [Bacteriovoracaceae bacterium]
MNKKTFILVSKKSIWPSHERVKKNLTLSYRRAFQSKKILVSDMDSLSKFFKELIALSWKEKKHYDVVLLDVGINLNQIAHFSKWVNPKTVSFHCLLHGDFILRIEEWRTLLNQLSGFKGSLRVCSEPMHLLAQKILGSQPFQVIPFPIDSIFFKVKKEKITKSPEIISYFGRITPDKGLLDLLKLWKKIKSPQRQLHLYGDFDSSSLHSLDSKKTFKNKFKKMREQIEHDQSIHQKKLTSDLQIIRAMDRSSYIINCSRFVHEEYGLAVREALVRGKPVLISRWGGHKDLESVPGAFFDLKKLNLKKMKPTDIKRSAQEKFSIEAVTKRIRALNLSQGVFIPVETKEFKRDQIKKWVQLYFGA